MFSAPNHSVYPDHAHVGTVRRPGPGAILDDLPESFSIVWSDDDRPRAVLIHRRTTPDRSKTPGANVFSSVDAVFAAAFGSDNPDKSALYLDRIEVAIFRVSQTPWRPASRQLLSSAEPQPLSTQHRVFVRPNSDLGRRPSCAWEKLEPKFKLWLRQGFSVLALASTQSQIERLRFLLEERGFARILMTLLSLKISLQLDLERRISMAAEGLDHY